MTIERLLGVGLDVENPPSGLTLPSRGIVLGLGADFSLLGGRATIAQFPTSLAHNLSVNTSALGHTRGLAGGNFYSYVVTAFVDDREYLQRNDYLRLGDQAESWTVSFEWQVDPQLRDLIRLGARTGYRVYRELIPGNTSGVISDPNSSGLERVAEIPLDATTNDVRIVDDGIASIGSAPAYSTSGDLTVSGLATVDSLRVGSTSSPGSGSARLQSNLYVGNNARVTNNLGVGVAAAPSMRVTIAGLAGPAEANLSLDATNVTGRMWHLASTAAGGFELRDDSSAPALSSPRIQVTGPLGNATVNLGHPELLPRLGAFTINDVNLPGTLLFPNQCRMLISPSVTMFNIGNGPIPAPVGALAASVAQRAGSFIIDDLSLLGAAGKGIAGEGGFGNAGYRRFEIDAVGAVSIGMPTPKFPPIIGVPTAPAGSLQIAHSLGIGIAAPPGAGDADIANNLWVGNDLDVMNDANVLNDLTVANNADILNDLKVRGDADVLGDLRVKGRKFFVQQHPEDPTKVITYAALEGPEAGTYVRGTAQLVDGEATIGLPESFRLVTAGEGLTAQVTLLEDCNGLYVAEKSTESIVVRELMNGTSSTRFDYLVQGVRKGYENFQVTNIQGSESEE